jgi:hypothetical protein
VRRWLLLAVAGIAISGCGGLVDSDRDPAGAAGAGASGGGSGVGGASGSGGTSTSAPLARGIRITEVTINQGVEIGLSTSGPLPAAPVVAGRAALVRVLVTTEPGFAPREILAELGVSGAPGHELSKVVYGSSTKSDATSGFSFRLEAQEITPATTLAVTLTEASPGVHAGSDAGARWPDAGAAPLGAIGASGTLNVVIVPVVANGFVPDTSEQSLAALQSRIRSMYPVSAASFTLRAPIAHSGPIAADGTGFDTLLDELVALRIADGAAYGAYYYGLLAPAASAIEFCSGGCVGGLSFKPGVLDDAWRCSIGVGHFPDGSHLGAPDVMAHELGHAHGLAHAPCDTPDPGPYPYPDAQIGVWGWDAASGLLMAPSAYRDVMSYCSPTWISDENYGRIFDRMSAVASLPDLLPPADPGRAPGRFRSATLGVDASLRWGATLELDRPVFGGETRRITLRDAGGRAIGAVDGYFHEFDHLPGGMLIVRQSTLAAVPEVHSLEPVGMGTALRL